MAANFKDDLVRGGEWEALFQKNYPEKLTKAPDLSHDFVMEDGRKLELKSDSYLTGNLFVERWSSLEGKLPGGPWQSLEKGVDVFCYFFVKENFWLECRKLNQLVDKLDILIENLPMVKVKNESWTTVGYLIEREQLWEYFDPYHLKGMKPNY